MSDLIIVGAGGHAKSALDVVEQESSFNVLGFVDNNLEKGTKVFSYEVLGKDDDLPELTSISENVLIAVGQIKDPDLRKKLYLKVKEIGFKLPNIISPKAYVSNDSEIGEGTIVMHGAIINAGARIGTNCIINTGSIIEHDVEIGDNCHVSTGVTVNGSVKIGNETFIGSGSVLRNNISIGRRCLIGMGSNIINDLPDKTNYKR